MSDVGRNHLSSRGFPARTALGWKNGLWIFRALKAIAVCTTGYVSPVQTTHQFFLIKGRGMGRGNHRVELFCSARICSVFCFAERNKNGQNTSSRFWARTVRVSYLDNMCGKLRQGHKIRLDPIWAECFCSCVAKCASSSRFQYAEFFLMPRWFLSTDWILDIVWSEVRTILYPYPVIGGTIAYSIYLMGGHQEKRLVPRRLIRRCMGLLWLCVIKMHVRIASGFFFTRDDSKLIVLGKLRKVVADARDTSAFAATMKPECSSNLPPEPGQRRSYVSTA